MGELSNQELVEIIQGSDPDRSRDALHVFVSRFYLLVFRLLFRLSRRNQVAEDLAQDVFVEFCTQEPFRQPNMNAPMLVSWLLTVTRRQWYRYVRDRRNRVEHMTPEQVGELLSREPNPLERADQKDSLAWLVAYLAELPSELREALTLRIEGLKYREMSERLGVSEGTLQWRVHQARARLVGRITADPELLGWLTDGGWLADPEQG